MSEGETLYRVDNGIAYVTFNRHKARNAMTWRMYEGLVEACEAMQVDANVRVGVFRGAGGEAFVAGTDIGQFHEFKSAKDGHHYEQRIAGIIATLEAVTKPTIAVIEGWATGGGLIIAAACDFRICTPSARFGVPIARTLGNCISLANVARLIAHFGTARVKRILLLAEFVAAEEAAACGFVEAVVPTSDLEAKIASLCERLKGHAPLTMQVSKEAIRRLMLHHLPDDEDLVDICYGSADFKEGMAAFLNKRKPDWRGR